MSAGRRAVGRGSRAIDVASIVLVLSGAGTYAYAFAGMRALRERAAADPGFVPGRSMAFEYLGDFVRLQRWSWAGVGLVVFGMLLGVAAAVHAYRDRSRLNAAA